MAIEIQDLPASGALAGDTVVPAVKDPSGATPVTQKVSVDQLQAYVEANSPTGILDWDATPAVSNPAVISETQLSYDSATGICTVGNAPLSYDFDQLTGSAKGGISRINTGIASATLGDTFQASIQCNFDQTTGTGSGGAFAIIGQVDGTGFTDEELFAFSIQSVFGPPTGGTEVPLASVKVLNESIIIQSSIIGGEVMTQTVQTEGDLSYQQAAGAQTAGTLTTAKAISFGGYQTESGEPTLGFGCQLISNGAQVASASDIAFRNRFRRCLRRYVHDFRHRRLYGCRNGFECRWSDCDD